MSYESADFLNGLDKNLPAATDSISEGDIHLRMIKKVLQDSFPNVTSGVNCIHGPLEPTVTSPGTVWFDYNGSGLIKMRDSTNTQWLNMAHGQSGGMGSTLKMEWHDLGDWSGRLGTGFSGIFNFDFSPLSSGSNLIIDITGSAGVAGYGSDQRMWIRLRDTTNDVVLTGDYCPAGFNHVDDSGNFEVVSGFSLRTNISSHPSSMFSISVEGKINNAGTESGQHIDMVQASVLEIE